MAVANNVPTGTLTTRAPPANNAELINNPRKRTLARPKQNTNPIMLAASNRRSDRCWMRVGAIRSDGSIARGIPLTQSLISQLPPRLNGVSQASTTVLLALVSRLLYAHSINVVSHQSPPRASAQKCYSLRYKHTTDSRVLSGGANGRRWRGFAASTVSNQKSWHGGATPGLLISRLACGRRSASAQTGLAASVPRTRERLLFLWQANLPTSRVPE